MQVTIEFYRTRATDDAHAVLGRVTREVNDLEDAIDVACSLVSTLAMPQAPDSITITDSAGEILHSMISPLSPGI